MLPFIRAIEGHLQFAQRGKTVQHTIKGMLDRAIQHGPRRRKNRRTGD